MSLLCFLSWFWYVSLTPWEGSPSLQVNCHFPFIGLPHPPFITPDPLVWMFCLFLHISGPPLFLILCENNYHPQCYQGHWVRVLGEHWELKRRWVLELRTISVPRWPRRRRCKQGDAKEESHFRSQVREEGGTTGNDVGGLILEYEEVVKYDVRRQSCYKSFETWWRKDKLVEVIKWVNTDERGVQMK